MSDVHVLSEVLRKVRPSRKASPLSQSSGPASVWSPKHRPRGDRSFMYESAHFALQVKLRDLPADVMRRASATAARSVRRTPDGSQKRAILQQVLPQNEANPKLLPQIR